MKREFTRLSSEKIELAVIANNLPTKRTYGINAKKKTVNDVSTKAESFSNIVKSYKWIREHTKVHDILKQQNEIQNGGQDTGR